MCRSVGIPHVLGPVSHRSFCPHRRKALSFRMFFRSDETGNTNCYDTQWLPCFNRRPLRSGPMRSLGRTQEEPRELSIVRDSQPDCWRSRPDLQGGAASRSLQTHGGAEPPSASQGAMVVVPGERGGQADICVAEGIDGSSAHADRCAPDAVSVAEPGRCSRGVRWSCSQVTRTDAGGAGIDAPALCRPTCRSSRHPILLGGRAAGALCVGVRLCDRDRESPPRTSAT